ncbi:hypothetical protein [Allokutzneria sp. NRRL B-24872]|uniref:hypothetical protein n=1 Tax=Allokutzneria sp. NRRL B-24872 TaxID=1137961 RepID=UPI000A38EA9D|nr:hypothetical protein [Allokutzneria sp. NRRL B-24872]
MKLWNVLTAAALTVASLVPFAPSAAASEECGSGYYCIRLPYGHEVRLYYIPKDYVSGQDTFDKWVWLDRSSDGGRTWKQMGGGAGNTASYKHENYKWRACINDGGFKCTGWH